LSFTRGSTDLKWTDGTPVDYSDPTTWGSKQGEVGYRVERAGLTGGVAGDWVKIADVPANQVTYTDNPADPTFTYDYKVTAWNEAGAAQSNVVRVEGLPKAPSNLQAVVVADPTLPAGANVTVSWTNNAGTATSIVLERADNGGAFASLATLAPSDTSFVDATVLPGSYDYRIKAVNGTLASAWTGPATAVVPKPGSSTVVLSQPNPSLVGDAVTVTATVSPVQAVSAPTGSVSFSVDGTVTQSVPLDASGQAVLTTSSLAAGTHELRADYGGDAVLQPSFATVSHVVNQRASAVTVVSSQNPSVVGNPVTFTATVSPADATGTVDLYIDASVVTRPLVAGAASYTTSALAIGGHTVTVGYNGDATYLGSVGNSFTQTVGTGLRATTTTVTSSLNPSTYGRSVTFTATVARVSGTGTPTGSVQFVIDGVNTGAPVALNTGRARYSTASLGAGHHSVVAVYGGSAVFAGSGSSAFVQNVLTATSTTTLTASRGTASLGQAITFTARVTPLAATGNVQFYLDGSAYGGPAALDGTGRATLPLSTLPVGQHTLQVLYHGNANYGASQSGVVTVTVTKGNSRTTLVTSGSPANRSTAVVFTATVAPVAPAFGVPNGSVQFVVDGVNAGTPVPLNPVGQAAYVTTTLPVGTHTVTAVYLGDGQFNGSTSGVLRQRIR